MKKIIYILPAIICMAVSCTEKPAPGPQPSPEKSLWEQENDPVECVSVYSGDRLIQTFTYEYDKNNRLTHIKRTDEATKVALFDLSLEYSGELDLKVSGSYLYASKVFTAAFNEDRDMLKYQEKDGNGMTYTLSLDNNDLPGQCKGTYPFNCNRYTSDISQRTVFDTEKSDITAISIATESDVATDKRTKANSERGIQYNYTYTGFEDQQNFAVYLVPCEFPIWAAAELPGCAHLISGMTCTCGGTVLPESFEVEYVLNDNGSINKAIRTDFSRGVKVSEIRYEFSYL